jgi:hypothetical protein
MWLVVNGNGNRFSEYFVPMRSQDDRGIVKQIVEKTWKV